MTVKTQRLLIYLLEELAETSQVVAKGLRFGLGCCHPDDPTTNNADLISHELNDVVAVALMLQANNDLSHITDDQMICAKQDRVRAYLNEMGL